MQYPGNANTPSLDDPRWEGWTTPLLQFLSQPKTWEELRVWRLAQKERITEYVLQNLLAWLSFYGLISYRKSCWCAIGEDEAEDEEIVEDSEEPEPQEPEPEYPDEFMG